MTDELLKRVSHMVANLVVYGSDSDKECADLITDLADRIKALVKERDEAHAAADYLTEHSKKVEARLGVLEAVVRCYASESLWDHDGGLDGLTPMERDKGHRARWALGLVPDREDDLKRDKP